LSKSLFRWSEEEWVSADRDQILDHKLVTSQTALREVELLADDRSSAAAAAWIKVLERGFGFRTLLAPGAADAADSIGGPPLRDALRGLENAVVQQLEEAEVDAGACRESYVHAAREALRTAT
jgi:hypothetical protein